MDEEESTIDTEESMLDEEEEKVVTEELKVADVAPLTFAILTISDTCARSEKIDESSIVLKQLIENLYNKKDDDNVYRKATVVCFETVPDEESFIKQILIRWCDEKIAHVILTTGGTGFSKRDVTPEATKYVIHKEAPGLYIAMLMSSIKITPCAMLSRAVCGIRNQTLIINLPGSPKGAKECFSAIAEIISHAVDLLLDNKEKIKSTHEIVQCNIPACINLNVATRPRKSPFPMISVEDAVQKIIESVKEDNRVGEVIDIKDAYGRVSFDDVYSSYALPPFRASTRDGYAVVASDGKGKRKVLCGVKAGEAEANVPFTLVPGTCVRINTGAHVPDGATAVVQVEDTKLISKTSDNTEEEEIEIMVESTKEENIRAVGSDIQKGSLILEAGAYISAVEMGLLAACGNYKISVQKRPSIGVLSTGDELQETGKALEPGHVYDSNRITLISLLKENNYNAVDFGIAIDDEMIMVNKIKEALEKVNVLVTTGSVSMGDRDILKPILEKHFKATIHFGRVNMKPGKPTTFATCIYKYQKKYFLCLPGNPVSAFVTAHLFVLPLLNHMQFYVAEPIEMVAKMSSDYKLDERPEYVRATLKWEFFDPFPLAVIRSTQVSSKLLNCKKANALLKLPQRTESHQVIHHGDLIPAILISKMAY